MARRLRSSPCGVPGPRVPAQPTGTEGRAGLAVANVIGSNLFNILGILGVTALVHPLAVPDAILSRDVFWMLGATVLLAPLMWTGYRVGRVEGAGLVAGFAVYLGWLLHAA